MTTIGRYIRFDWAMKRLLRDKANFGIIEGLLTTLLGEKIKIKEMLESESNSESEYSKQNRVDVLAEGENGELYLIEVQNNNDIAYFQRMLFGTSQLVTQYLHRGESYQSIRKIYSVNIVYFHLGNGSDYVYHGTTEFRGIHNNDILNLSRYQMQRFQTDTVSGLFPEYYILKVNDFNIMARTPLEEWISFLRSGEIPENASAPGLDVARERLNVMNMSDEERRAYYKQVDDLVVLQNNIETERAESRAEGRAEGIADMIKAMYKNGMSIEQISNISQLTFDEVNRIIAEQ